MSNVVSTRHPASPATFERAWSGDLEGRSGWAERPNLIVNPIGDTVFEEHVRWSAPLSDRPDDLQERLRHAYPAAVVRRRELSGETFEMWYVYRDGRWAPPER